MKVFLFNVESGIFEGEDYCDADEIFESEGITCMAPPALHPGFVPVYEQSIGSWKLVPITNFNRQGYK